MIFLYGCSLRASLIWLRKMQLIISERQYPVRLLLLTAIISNHYFPSSNLPKCFFLCDPNQNHFAEIFPFLLKVQNTCFFPKWLFISIFFQNVFFLFPKCIFIWIIVLHFNNGYSIPIWLFLSKVVIYY